MRICIQCAFYCLPPLRAISDHLLYYKLLRSLRDIKEIKNVSLCEEATLTTATTGITIDISQTDLIGPVVIIDNCTQAVA